MEVPSRETKPKQQEQHIRDKKTKEGDTTTYLGLPSFLPIWISRSPFAPSGPRLPYSSATTDREIVQRVEPREEATQARECVSETERDRSLRGLEKVRESVRGRKDIAILVLHFDDSRTGSKTTTATNDHPAVRHLSCRVEKKPSID